jgi:hypothetical protein
VQALLGGEAVEHELHKPSELQHLQGSKGRNEEGGGICGGEQRNWRETLNPKP